MKKTSYKIVRILFVLALACGSLHAVSAADDAGQGFMPGQRVLLDAHNCYPYQGRWADRLERALGTGLPLALEQDLVWYTDPESGESRSIVSHGKPFTGEEPSIEEYFFETVRPLVERALKKTDRSDWPLITLNLDIKDNVIEHTAVVWETLKKYDAWITSAIKMDDITKVQELHVKPMLVLSKGNGSEFEAFYERIPTGDKLLVFGVARTSGGGTAPPEEIFRLPSDNFRRWWNSAWSVVETGGQRRAGDWTAAEAARLKALVDRAHQRGYWVRLYTLNGVGRRVDMGWSTGYDFGSGEAVALRWRAASEAGVDFIASDQYEDLSGLLKVVSAKRSKEEGQWIS